MYVCMYVCVCVYVYILINIKKFIIKNFLHLELIINGFRL